MNVVAYMIAILALNNTEAKWSSREFNNGWTPIHSDFPKYKHISIYPLSQYSVNTDSNEPVNNSRTKPRRRIISLKEDSPFNIPESAFFRQLREISSSIIDANANHFVNVCQRIFGSRSGASYDPEGKIVTAFGIEFDILLALEQAFLTFTEMVAYVTTDIVFRTFWPV